MKLHRLELEGFGPFREPQVVDFDAFDDDGLFLISGRTGAGKSSILDGVSFALYGSVPRYESGDRRLRSDYSAPDDTTRVSLELTVGGARWRVTRSPDYQRPAKRGGGMTTEPARVEVAEQVAGQWVVRAARAREAGEKLNDVLGLTAQQFQQVILLAQNKFARFLLASNHERQALLRTLFGSERFEKHKQALEDRKRDAQRAVEGIATQVRTLLEVAERRAEQIDNDTQGEASESADALDLSVATDRERRDAVERATQRARYQAEAATHATTLARESSRAAQERYARVAEHTRVLAELTRAREKWASLDAAQADVDADARQVRRANEAEVLRSALDAAERAAALAEAARVTLDGARETWRATAVGSEEPASVIERLTGEIALWQRAADRERQLAGDERELATLDARLTSLAEQRESGAAWLAQEPALRAELSEKISAARADAVRAEKLDAEVAAARERLAAAQRAAALAQQLADAEAGRDRADSAALRAAETLTDLYKRRIDGRAGELAQTLRDGEPCAVCGSTTHPAPAPPSDDPVTDEALARAQAESERAGRLARDAAATAKEIATAHAAAVAEAGDAPLEDLAERLSELVAQADAARSGANAEQARAGERDALDAQVEQTRAEDAQLALQQSEAREQRAALNSRIREARDEVSAARGDAESVAERIAAAQQIRARARALVEAVEQGDAADRARRAADEDLAARLDASDFADSEEVRQALRGDAVRADIAERVTAHQEARAAVRERLLTLELEAVGLSDDDLDLDAAAAERDRADAAKDAASAHAAARERDAESLNALLQQIDSALGEVTSATAEAEAVIRLADTVAGRAPNTKRMDLETFVLAAELEEIVEAANLRLGDMTGGRYSLHHSDALSARGAASGLGLEVLDAHTGVRRSPHSLSGGETFLASLALALGLAQVVTSRAGGVRIDTLFIDEGFGSLDPETLELAMRTLDELRAGGRTVGVISHVDTMKEQISAQLTVTAMPDGPSVITQDLFSASPHVN